MERPLLIIQFITGLLLIFGLTFAQERWNISADGEIEGTKINGQEVRRLNEKVRFVKTGKVILADNAAQYIRDDVLHLNGNTIMIKTVMRKKILMRSGCQMDLKKQANPK